MARRQQLRHLRNSKHRSASATAAVQSEPSSSETRPCRVVVETHANITSTHVEPPWSASTEEHTQEIQEARHEATSGASPTLGDRFHSLPAEIRSYIFSLLVVRPVKWDVKHHDRSINHLSSSLVSLWECASNCATRSSVPCWRDDRRFGNDVWQSRWRSKWAPRQLNPYVCTFCYNGRLREGHFPKPVSLRCLCARRKDLEVFLVCKDWYEEAAVVFYTQNTFAFEGASTFVEFAQNLNPRWRRTISKISIVFSWAVLPEAHEEGAAGISAKNWLSLAWSQLNNFPALSYCELDYAFLTSVKTVRALLRLRLPRLRRLRFVSHRAMEQCVVAEPETSVWPSMANRKLMQGGFAEVIARAVKNQRRSKYRYQGSGGQISQKEIKAGVEEAGAHQVSMGLVLHVAS